jgi:hypothetical protein
VTDLGNLAYSAAHAGLTTRAEVVARRALRLAETHDLEPEVAAFARLTLAIALSKRGRPADEVRTLVDEALVQLGTRSAPTERKIITELARAHGWDDLDRPD